MRRAGLRLVTNTDPDIVADTHCSLCLFQEFNEIPCYHERSKPLPKLPSSAISSPISPSGHSRFFSRTSLAASDCDSATELSPTTDVPDSDVDQESTPSPRRSLRRKASPKDVTLRELKERHSQQSSLRSMKSDEELQRVYESQILAYLDGPWAELDAFI